MPKRRPAPENPDEISRYTQRMTNGHQHKLASFAKGFKISQQEVLEAMIDHIDMAKMGPIFKKIRDDKVAERVEKKEMLKKLSKLNFDELRELVESADA